MAKRNSGGPSPGDPDFTAPRELLFVETRLGLCGVGLIGGCAGRLWLPGGNKGQLTSAMREWADGFAPGRDGDSLLADKISRYFEGERVGFEDVNVALPGISVFARTVLERLRDVEWGRTVTYRDIALSLNRPGSARAIGVIMSKNPIPLIIPCHRVIMAGGGLGGFSGAGGVEMKKKMLELEGFRDKAPPALR